VSAAHRLFTDGSAYATMPANVPAHNLAALTISFYYQRESSGGKQILLAAGKGSQAGDFSFRGAGGRTAAGLAHRPGRRAALLRQHHPQGARLYLDGTQVVAAAISQNTNGWNNTRVKYLGLWTAVSRPQRLAPSIGSASGTGSSATSLSMCPLERRGADHAQRRHGSPLGVQPASLARRFAPRHARGTVRWLAQY
jgi:hypothetical protein